MLEQIINYIGTLDPVWIYFVLFFFSFIENVFPPSPSDVVVVVGATLIASTTLGYIPILTITAVGSALGFLLMYYLGKLFGEKIIRAGKLKFITPETLRKPDEWFAKYGYELILANRFLPGTRSVISFFSGVHELHIGKTFVYALISAFAWNAMLVFAGMKLGQNIQALDYYLSAYRNIIAGVTVVIIIAIVLRYFIQSKKKIGKNV